MKKVISLLMALTMLMSTIVVADLSAFASGEYYNIATPVALNGVWSGDIWDTSDTDQWYKISIPSDGKLTLKVMSYKNDTNFYLRNYDLTSTVIDEDWGIYGSEVSPKTNTYERALSAGDYYMNVWGTNGKYKICALFESYNTNDFGANSYDSPLVVPMNYQITGARTETDSEDWFAIDVPYAGHYCVTVVSYKYDTEFYLKNYDLTSTVIDEYWGVDGSETEPKTQRYNVVLGSGRYYLNFRGGTGKYLFTWAPLTPENCDHEYTTQKVKATCTSKGYTIHTCKNCGNVYNDSYTEFAQHDMRSTVTYPTYFKGGYTTYTCANCGYSYVTDYTKKYTVSKSSIYKLKSGKKKIAVMLNWGYGIDGIQIQYSTDKKFKKGVKTTSTKKGSKAIKKLKGKKKYYVRVRSYKISNNRKAYSSWSKVKSITTKR